MTNDLTKILQNLAGMRLWIGLMAVLAVGLVGYYSFLGVRYWQARQRLASVERVMPGYQQANSDHMDGLQQYLDTLEQEQTQLRQVFDYPSLDEVTAAVASATRAAQVDVKSIIVGDSEHEKRGGILYQTLPMTITLQGERFEIYRFVSLLNDEVSVGVVREITLSDLDSTPSALVRLLFYLSPDGSSETQGEKS